MSTEQLRQGPRRVVGAKEALKKLAAGRVTALYVARDAEPNVVQAVVASAEAHKIPIYYVETKGELGQQCGIQVGAACAATLAP